MKSNYLAKINFSPSQTMDPGERKDPTVFINPELDIYSFSIPTRLICKNLGGNFPLFVVIASSNANQTDPEKGAHSKSKMERGVHYQLQIERRSHYHWQTHGGAYPQLHLMLSLSLA